MSVAADATDLAILRLVARDATLSAAEIGRAVGLTQPAAWRRLKRLREAGVIRGRRVEVDPAALGFTVTVFLGIRLAAKGRLDLEAFDVESGTQEFQVFACAAGHIQYRPCLAVVEFDECHESLALLLILLEVIDSVVEL